MWREAKSLRRWIVQEKQRITIEASEKTKDTQEKGSDGKSSRSSPATEMESSTTTSTTTTTTTTTTPQVGKVDKTSYEYFRDMAISKLSGLLQLHPSSLATASQALVSMISGCVRPQPWLSHATGLTNFVVTDYVKNAPKFSALSILRRREMRAQSRAEAMQAIQHLLQSLSMLSAKHDILRISSRAWRCAVISHPRLVLKAI